MTPGGTGGEPSADAALLALSRDLADARAEADLSAALARGLEVLFPGRTFAIRLLDPGTLALTTLYARGRLRPSARGRLALRRGALLEGGLDAEAHRAAGVALVEEDEPLFQGSTRALCLPLAVSGQLFGLVSLEYAEATPGSPEVDEPLLERLANHAALGVRNVRSMEELLRLRVQQERLVDHANALVFAVDRERRITLWNRALVRHAGFEHDAVVGQPLAARLPAEEWPRMEAALARAFAGDSVDLLETRLARPGGGETRVALSLGPVAGATGDVETVIAIGQDLTLLRSMQAAAEHAERLAGLGRLVAGVVHELNNPLTAVTMYSDVLAEKMATRGDAADLEKIKAIKEAGQRIFRLARDLVTYARPGGLKTEPVDLAQVIDEAARMAKPALKESAALLEREVGPLPPVDANRASLVQVLLALLANASQAIAKGGHIQLRAGAADGEVRLAVQDDGEGMTPDVQARAFEPFFTTRSGTGIGLGLPIVAGIVERHGGRVEVATAPGKGTTVTVVLPVVKAAAG